MRNNISVYKEKKKKVDYASLWAHDIKHHCFAWAGIAEDFNNLNVTRELREIRLNGFKLIHDFSFK